ncbi:MAG TPA: hypothetical protein VKB35_19885 [Ktedonobacteraceae bacterium]|nr:hypothetical protein [Ktedonobacteraceae bacterium]
MLRSILQREERIRLDIIKDLVKFDLLTCKPISTRRSTAHLTRVLPDAPTEVDPLSTETMPTGVHM